MRSTTASQVLRSEVASAIDRLALVATLTREVDGEARDNDGDLGIGSVTTAWHPRREVGVRPGALSSMSSSDSSASLSLFIPSLMMTWQVVQAQLPPHACSR